MFLSCFLLMHASKSQLWSLGAAFRGARALRGARDRARFAGAAAGISSSSSSDSSSSSSCVWLTYCAFIAARFATSSAASS